MENSRFGAHAPTPSLAAPSPPAVPSLPVGVTGYLEAPRDDKDQWDTESFSDASTDVLAEDEDDRPSLELEVEQSPLSVRVHRSGSECFASPTSQHCINLHSSRVLL